MLNKQKYTIYFHGLLGKVYGIQSNEVYGRNIQEAFSWLSARFGTGFRETILQGSWHITQGTRESEILSETDNFIPEDLITFPIESTELHIFPAITGSGRGVGQIVVGVVLLVIATVVTFGAALGVAGALGAVGVTAGFSATTAMIGLAGAAALAQGIMQATSATPTMNDYAAAAGTDPKASFLYNGIVNNTEQGVPVPLVYGLHLTGSTVVSSGLDVEQLLDGSAFN